MNGSFIRKKLFLFLVFLITISFVKGKLITIDLTASIENDKLEVLSASYENYKWIPSLIYQTLLVSNEFITTGYTLIETEISLYNPLLPNIGISASLYMKQNFIKEISNVHLAKCDESTIMENYIGLSLGVLKINDVKNDDYIFLFDLQRSQQIDEKIFSFSKWELKNNILSSSLYIGNVHEHFTSNDGIIGSCENNDDNFWACSFKEMIFNDKKISLMKEDNKEYYKIYFLSDNYNIIFPSKFQKEIEEKTNHKCKLEETNEFKCEGFFNENDYFPLTLVNETINITLEVDNSKRYISDDDTQKEKTNIIFKSYDFIIFPLIMFKQFHVQFNAEKKVISFYTTDGSILKVKDSQNNIPDQSTTSSTSTGTILLVILIILLILALLFGIFYFIKKKRGSTIEKNINRFTKFEDEEDFKNMNENKVY